MDKSDIICKQIQDSIDLARKDQKYDYDQFKKLHESCRQELRDIQKAIESLEKIYMQDFWENKN